MLLKSAVAMFMIFPTKLPAGSEAFDFGAGILGADEFVSLLPDEVSALTRNRMAWSKMRAVRRPSTRIKERVFIERAHEQR